MKKFIFVDFDENILKKAVLDNYKENIAFILPSHSSKKELKKIYQQQYKIADASFFTMEELKDYLFVADMPIVKEDKRNLLLYSVLSNDEKRYFHISDYFSSIKFADEFFAYFTDLNEGNLSSDEILTQLSNSLSDISKQQLTLSIANDIKERYLDILNRYGYTDKIFVYKNENLPAKLDFDYAVVVNQFYFTELEKSILNLFDDVFLYLQMPKDLYDTKKMKLSDKFGAKNLQRILTEKITYTLSENKNSMYVNMLADLSDKPAFIIDLDFKNFSYKSLLNKQLFSFNNPSFKSTAIFDFLLLISDFAQEKKNSLLPIAIFVKAFQNKAFTKYFSIDDNLSNVILTYFYQLYQNEIKFIDLDFIKKNAEQNLTNALEKIFAFLDNLFRITELSQFVSAFENFISVERIGFESQNAAEVFYQSLYDIYTLKSIEPVFEKEQKSVGFFLNLFLNHLKYKTYRVQESDAKYFFQSLLDTRNLSFSNVIILNLINGKLPSAPRSSFFLTEMQKKRLNILTYEDLRLREKYYLYRLIAVSKNVSLYSWQNIEENIEPSSFIEELLLHFPYIEKIYTKESDTMNYKELYNAMIDKKINPIGNDESVLNEPDFYRFPFENEKRLFLSHSAYLQIKEEPFIYYLKNKLKIPFWNTEIKEEFSPAFQGNFVHTVFSKMFHRIKHLYQYPDEKMVYNKHIYPKAAFESAIANLPDFKYKKNYNENDIYFETFFKMFLLDSMENFIYQLYQKIKDYKFARYIPEDDENKKLTYKPLGEIEDVFVEITGFSDLRVETDKKYFIFDYKTSPSSKFNKLKDQLKFYEFFYYDDAVLPVESAFYFVFNEVFKSASFKSEKVTLFEVISKFISELKKGYIATDKNRYTIDITRADKMKNMR